MVRTDAPPTRRAKRLVKHAVKQWHASYPQPWTLARQAVKTLTWTWTQLNIAWWTWPRRGMGHTLKLARGGLRLCSHFKRRFLSMSKISLTIHVRHANTISG
jgi:hypothetical protein